MVATCGSGSMYLRNQILYPGFGLDGVVISFKLCKLLFVFCRLSLFAMILSLFDLSGFFFSGVCIFFVRGRGR